MDAPASPDASPAAGAAPQERRRLGRPPGTASERLRAALGGHAAEPADSAPAQSPAPIEAEPAPVPPAEPEILQVRFGDAVRWLGTERTSLDLAAIDVARYSPTIRWCPQGIRLEAGRGEPTLIVPMSNVIWIRVR
jgi:hypothetical protein